MTLSRAKIHRDVYFFGLILLAVSLPVSLFFTSVSEGTSSVVLESISNHLPVFCFNTCGFGPIVTLFAVAKERKMTTCQVLTYGHSGQTCGNSSQVVAYSSIILGK